MQPPSVKPTYSIILMRDDLGVSAFRLHSFWIKLFIFLLVLLIAAGALGAYGTFYYKNRYEATASERRDLQRALGENKIKLESLINEGLVGRFTGGDPGPSRTQTANLSTPYISTPTIVPNQSDLAVLLRQIGPMRSAGTENDLEEDALMEQHPVRISNLKTAFEGDDRLRVTYDLHNQQPGLTLIGRCGLALITREGAVIDITAGARGVLTFQIARYRKMDILSRIPPNVKKENISKIQVSAQANDLPPYQKQFAFFSE
ncbi:MAG: hypothetical protein FWG17_04230 [Desulfovibrionaceae bacterium]|nr:hypothetical protein [Desulfovibrionaceae bacterium]